MLVRGLAGQFPWVMVDAMVDRVPHFGTQYVFLEEY